MKMKFLAALAAISIAGTAQAVTLKVEIWDVLAPEPGCCTGNNEAQQVAAWVTTPGNTVALIDNSGNFFNGGFSAGTSTGGFDEAGVDYIVANLTPDLMFNIDSSALVTGFFANGLASNSATPSIDDFFGTSLGGVGSNAILGTVARITGNLSVAAGDTFDVASDDGYRLTVGGEVLAFQPDLNGNLTPVTSSAVSASNGNAGFELIWFEGNTVGAALQVQGDFKAVPLPAGGLLLLTALGGVALLRRRRQTG